MKKSSADSLKVFVLATLAMLITACSTHKSSQVIVEDRTGGSVYSSESSATEASGTENQKYDNVSPSGSQSSADTEYKQGPSNNDSASKSQSSPAYAPTTKQSMTQSTGVVSSIEPKGAVLALLEKAEIQHQQGQNQQALTSLERAQRIAPRQPAVYLQLARLLNDMGQTQKAKQFARKGLSLSSGNEQLQKAFNAILDNS